MNDSRESFDGIQFSSLRIFSYLVARLEASAVKCEDKKKMIQTRSRIFSAPLH